PRERTRRHRHTPPCELARRRDAIPRRPRTPVVVPPSDRRTQSAPEARETTQRARSAGRERDWGTGVCPTPARSSRGPRGWGERPPGSEIVGSWLVAATSPARRRR